MSILQSDGQICASKVLEVIPLVMQELRAEMRLNAKANLTVPQFRLLARLQDRAVSPGELAEWIGVSLPAISRMAEILAKKDLLRKTQNQADRRQWTLKLTPKGNRIVKRVRLGARQKIAGHLAYLSDLKKNQLLIGLEILRELFLHTEELNETREFINATALPSPYLGVRPGADFAK